MLSATTSIPQRWSLHFCLHYEFLNSRIAGLLSDNSFKRFSLLLLCNIVRKSVESIVSTEVAQVRMKFIVDSCDLNDDVFNESTGYHVLPDYDPHGGYLKSLQSEVRVPCFTASR